MKATVRRVTIGILFCIVTLLSHPLTMSTLTETPGGFEGMDRYGSSLVKEYNPAAHQGMCPAVIIYE